MGFNKGHGRDEDGCLNAADHLMPSADAKWPEGCEGKPARAAGKCRTVRGIRSAPALQLDDKR